jgi:hypothetical protein
MKVLVIVLLSLIVLMTGCSNSSYRASSLWQERQMDDDRRIYGNPYESSHRSLSIQLPATY